MSNHSRSNSDSPSASSPTTPRLVEPHKFTRFADAGFGNRLADARNLMHTQASPVPALARQEHRKVVGSVASEVANSIRQAALIPPGAPKHGWEKGSYRSPFDYQIPGHRVGGKDSASAGSLLHASPSSLSPFTPLGSMKRTDSYATQKTPEYEMKPRTESDPPCRTVTPGPDAKERFVLLGPLRMIRKTGVALRPDDREKLYSFIDSYMADSLHTVVERDGILPNVVYRVSISMTNANWVKYNQLLAVFGFASGMHALLSVGSDEFDEYTYVVDGTNAECLESWKVLASASEKGI